MFVRHRTSHILSLQSMVNRNCGTRISGNAIKRLEQADAELLFDYAQLVAAARNSIVTIRFLTHRVKDIEQEVSSQVTLRDEFASLLTIMGIGKILASPSCWKWETLTASKRLVTTPPIAGV